MPTKVSKHFENFENLKHLKNLNFLKFFRILEKKTIKFRKCLNNMNIWKTNHRMASVPMLYIKVNKEYIQGLLNMKCRAYVLGNKTQPYITQYIVNI